MLTGVFAVISADALHHGERAEALFKYPRSEMLRQRETQGK